MSRSVVRVLILASLVAGCSSPGASTPAPSGTGPGTPSPAASVAAGTGASVIVEKFKFTPAEVRVPVGGAVVWTNRELALHTVTAGTPGHPSGLFDSGTFDTGQTFAFTFANAGQYPYFCSRHNVMLGLVIVGP